MVTMIIETLDKEMIKDGLRRAKIMQLPEIVSLIENYILANANKIGIVWAKVDGNRAWSKFDIGDNSLLSWMKHHTVFTNITFAKIFSTIAIHYDTRNKKFTICASVFGSKFLRSLRKLFVGTEINEEYEKFSVTSADLTQLKCFFEILNSVEPTLKHIKEGIFTMLSIVIDLQSKNDSVSTINNDHTINESDKPNGNDVLKLRKR